MLILSRLDGKTERSQLEGKELTWVSLNILHAASGKTLHKRGTGVCMCHAGGDIHEGADIIEASCKPYRHDKVCITTELSSPP